MIQRPLDSLSNDNTLFCTEQCNNHCIMCCQPPKKTDDIDILFQENLLRIKNAPKDLPIIGITGGEPTLLGEKLIDLIRQIREQLPGTDIHILSNGRNFKDMSYSEKVVSAGDGRIIFGIPLHSDYSGDHDIIAGCRNAFYETIQGLYNLALCEACIELRVVINKLNYQRLHCISEFINKNLPFVTWTAFMGMEYTGYAVEHSNQIWVEPIEYMSKLQKAVHTLDEWHYKTCIYNIPLCLLTEDLHEFAEQSISDWKNEYYEICDGCTLKAKCSGGFTTSIKPYRGLHTIKNGEI